MEPCAAHCWPLLTDPIYLRPALWGRLLGRKHDASTFRMMATTLSEFPSQAASGAAPDRPSPVSTQRAGRIRRQDSRDKTRVMLSVRIEVAEVLSCQCLRHGCAAEHWDHRDAPFCPCYDSRRLRWHRAARRPLPVCATFPVGARIPHRCCSPLVVQIDRSLPF
jgi:hypothetical protein